MRNVCDVTHDDRALLLVSIMHRVVDRKCNLPCGSLVQEGAPAEYRPLVDRALLTLSSLDSRQVGDLGLYKQQPG